MNTSAPVKFMDGKTQSTFLHLILIDSSWPIPNPNNVKGEEVLKPKTGSTNDPKLWSCQPQSLVTYLSATNKAGAPKYIDVRNTTDKSLPGKKQLPGAFAIAMNNDSNAETTLASWKTANAVPFAQLLQASHVIIYCNLGETRSPAMVKAYAAAYKAATNKNKDQYIALLNTGVDGVARISAAQALLAKAS